MARKDWCFSWRCPFRHRIPSLDHGVKGHQKPQRLSFLRMARHGTTENAEHWAAEHRKCLAYAGKTSETPYPLVNSAENYGKAQCLIGKSIMSMAIFNSKLLVCQRVIFTVTWKTRVAYAVTRSIRIALDISASDIPWSPVSAAKLVYHGVLGTSPTINGTTHLPITSRGYLWTWFIPINQPLYGNYKDKPWKFGADHQTNRCISWPKIGEIHQKRSDFGNSTNSQVTWGDHWGISMLCYLILIKFSKLSWTFTIYACKSC